MTTHVSLSEPNNPLRRDDAGGVAYPSPWYEFWSNFSRNKGALLGLVFVSILLLCALFAPWIAPHDPAEQYRDALLAPPLWQEGGRSGFFLGTDELGRDMLSRLIYGARTSLFVSFAAVSFAMLSGVMLGLVAAFSPKVIGAVLMRVMDILMALPALLLALAIVAILGPGLLNTIIAITVVAIPAFVRITRATAMTELSRDYVVASRVAGAGLGRLMWITVLPNCLAPLIVHATMNLSSGILEIAALGFLGLGVQPPTAEWGTMLSSARDFIESAWWVVMFPGLMILCSVLSINLMGDGLRDALDPKLKKIQ